MRKPLRSMRAAAGTWGTMFWATSKSIASAGACATAPLPYLAIAIRTSASRNSHRKSRLSLPTVSLPSFGFSCGVRQRFRKDSGFRLHSLTAAAAVEAGNGDRLVSPM